MMTLLFIPTAFERDTLLGDDEAPDAMRVEIVGLGPVAAAARAAQRIAEVRPARVVLAGLAGTFDPERHPIGSVMEFGEVAIDGIGVGEGEKALGLDALGFPQWEDERGRVVDRLPLDASDATNVLLTVSAASADARHAALRRRRVPDAVAEDMEGFGVALACRMAGVPLRIVRGIGNRVGDRDTSGWAIEPALAAVRERLNEFREDPTAGGV